MKIKTVVLGKEETNGYLLEINRHLLLIDPVDDYSKIEKEIGTKKVVGILVTHNPSNDETINKIVEKYKVKVFDFHHLKEGHHRIKHFKFETIKTPGVYKDGMCYYFVHEKAMFTGATVLKGSVGKVNQPKKLYQSIIKIKKFPNNTVIYPAYGDKTKLKDEKEENPYF